MNLKTEAIDFLLRQQYYNKENIEILDKLGIETKEMQFWDSLYDYTLNVLKEG